MRHFIAYHSTERMGYLFHAGKANKFLTRKPLSYLQNHVKGNKVWMISSERGSDRKLIYKLHGYYIARDIRKEDDEEFTSSVGGEMDLPLLSPVKLNGLDWFEELFRSQNNFSYGLNEIKQESIFSELEKLA